MTKIFRKRFDELVDQLSAVETTKRSHHSELTGQYEAVDDERLLNWRVKAKNLLTNACGKDSEHFLSFVEAEKPRAFVSNVDTLKRVKAVFYAAKEDYEGGYLQSIRSLVQADVFENELDQSRELLSSGYHAASAVVAGVVLETTLRSICAKYNIPIGKLEKMNADLTKAGHYNSPVQKKITALYAIRNSAAHGNSNAFTKEDVSLMITEVERLVTDALT